MSKPRYDPDAPLRAIRHELRTAGMLPLKVRRGFAEWDWDYVAYVANPEDVHNAVVVLRLGLVAEWVDRSGRAVAQGDWAFDGRRVAVTIYGPEKSP